MNILSGKLIIAAVFLLALGFATSVSATTCVYDWECPNNYFCDEGNVIYVANETNNYVATCQPVVTTACNHTLSCTLQSQCHGIGKGICSTSKGICLSESDVGFPCQLDGDCGSYQDCVLGVCTDWQTSPYTPYCRTNSQCPPDQTCVGTELIPGMCISKGKIGTFCVKNSNCLSGICDSVERVCTECDSTWGVNGILDGIKKIPEGQFCNIYYKPSCSWGWDQDFYVPYSIKNNKQTATLEALRGDGEPCFNDGCCVSGDICEGGYCVKGGDYPIGGGNMSTTFCSNTSYGYSLSTYWFDKAVSITILPNVTVFRNFFGISDLYAVRFNVSGNDLYPTEEVVFKRQSSATQKNMSALFYSNSTGNLCYFRQISTNIFWDCVAAGSGLARTINSATSIIIKPETGLNVGDSTLRIMISNRAGSGYYQQSAIILRVSDTNSLDVYDSFVNSLAVPMAIICGWNGASYTTILENTGSNCFYDTTSFPHIKNRWCYDRSYTFSGVQQTLRAANYGYGETTCALETSTFGPSTTSFTLDDIDSEIISCCGTDADCETLYGLGWICDPSSMTCQFSPENTTGKTSSKFIYTFLTDYKNGDVCVNSSNSIQIETRDSNNVLIPGAIVTVSVTGSGSVYPTTCYTNPCSVTFTAPATAGTSIVNFDYAGDSIHGGVSLGIFYYPKNNCHFITFNVVDGLNPQNPLYNIGVTWLNHYSYFTNSQGTVTFSNLNSTASGTMEFKQAGWTTFNWNFTSVNLDKTYQVLLFHPGQQQNQTQPELSWNMSFSPPNSTSAVMEGLQNITFSLFGYYFPMIMIFVIFFIALGLILLGFKAVL